MLWQRKAVRVLFFSVLFLAASVLVIGQVLAHGSMETPISRAFHCFLEGPENLQSAACIAARNVSGTQQFYDWHEINQGQAAGRHREIIPDGQLCGAGRAKYAGLNLARADWPAQTIAPDQNGNFEFIYRATAPHSTLYFEFYVTKDGYNPTQPLKWSDLEASPFCTITDPFLQDGRYRMTCPLPQKSGRHLIYNIWQRDDSPEAFYSCSDVIFGDDVPTPTIVPTDVPPGECTAAPWDSGQIYVKDNVVSHNGREWRAKWWTQGEEPGTTGQWGVWEDRGPCSGDSTPVPTPTDEPPSATPSATPDGDVQTWAPNTAYSVGQVVSFNGNTYECIQAHTSQTGWEPPIVPALWSLQN